MHISRVPGFDLQILFISLTIFDLRNTADPDEMPNVAFIWVFSVKEPIYRFLVYKGLIFPIWLFFFRVATVREKVLENENFSRSGKSQGITFSVGKF